MPRANRETARNEAQALLAQHVQRFTLALSRNAFTIRSGRDAVLEFGDTEGICLRTLGRLGRYPNVAGRFAIYGRDATRPCLSPGFTPPAGPGGTRPEPDGRDHAGRRASRYLPLRARRHDRGH